MRFLLFFVFFSAPLYALQVESKPMRVGHLKLSPNIDQERFSAQKNDAGFVIVSDQLISVLESSHLAALPLTKLDSPPNWVFKLPTPITAPLFSNGTLLIAACLDGKLHSLNALTGELLWSVDLPNSHVKRPMTQVGDSLYVVTIDEHVHRIDLKNKKIIWTFENPQTSSLPLTGAPPIAFDPKNRNLLFGASQGEIKSIDLDTGKMLWSYFSDAASQAKFRDVVGQLAVIENVVVYSRYDGIIEALDLQTHSVLWRNVTFASEITTSVATSSGFFVGTPQGLIASLNTKDGKLAWSKQLVGSVFSLASMRERLVVSTSPGLLASLFLTSGEIMWADPLEASLASPAPFFLDQQPTFLTQSGNVYIYENL